MRVRIRDKVGLGLGLVQARVKFGFAISECLRFTLASFAPFAFRSPIVRRFSFLAPFSASVFIHSSLVTLAGTS